MSLFLIHAVFEKYSKTEKNSIRCKKVADCYWLYECVCVIFSIYNELKEKQ